MHITQIDNYLINTRLIVKREFYLLTENFLDAVILSYLHEREFVSEQKDQIESETSRHQRKEPKLINGWIFIPKGLFDIEFLHCAPASKILARIRRLTRQGYLLLQEEEEAVYCKFNDDFIVKQLYSVGCRWPMAAGNLQYSVNEGMIKPYDL